MWQWNLLLFLGLSLNLLLMTSCKGVSIDQLLNSDGTNSPSEPFDVIEFQMIAEYGDLEPEEIVRSLELKPSKIYEDYIDLGTGYLWEGNFLKAAEAYEVAAQQADSRQKLSGALYNKSAALAYAGYMQEALSAIDSVVTLQPNNKEVAWLRYALYQRGDDELGLIVATDHLLRVDTEISGSEVLDPLTAAVITGAIIIAAVTVTEIAVVALVPPEDRREVVLPTMKGYYSIVGNIGVLSPTTTSTLGRKLAIKR